MSGQPDTSRAFKLTLLTAAVGAGSMGAASAATISTVPAKYRPAVFTTGTASSQNFDTDGNGTLDFTISSSGNSIYLAPISASNSYSGFVEVNSYSTPDNFTPVTSLKSNSSGGVGSDYFTAIGDSSGASSQFSPNVPMYAELGTNLTYDTNGNITGGTVGYFLATRAVLSGAGTSSEIDSITINDYGVIASTAVPEPSSLALLAMGGVGVAALRRRQARRQAERGGRQAA